MHGKRPPHDAFEAGISHVGICANALERPLRLSFAKAE